MKNTASCKTLFVTVGTTKFDKLVETIISNDIIDNIVQSGYNKLIIQRGGGSCIVNADDINKLDVECYQFKDSIQDDIASADLVISHAGAGSVLETLTASKPLIVVVNEDLMGNHQYELAEKMAEEGHLYFCTCKTLSKTLRSKDLSLLKPLPPLNECLFGEFVDNVMGVTD